MEVDVGEAAVALALVLIGGVLGHMLERHQDKGRRRRIVQSMLIHVTWQLQEIDCSVPAFVGQCGKVSSIDRIIEGGFLAELPPSLTLRLLSTATLMELCNRDFSAREQIEPANFSPGVFNQLNAELAEKQDKLKALARETDKLIKQYLNHLALLDKWYIPSWWPYPKELNSTTIKSLSAETSE